VCNLKVIDPSLNVKDQEGAFATVCIVGRRF